MDDLGIPLFLETPFWRFQNKWKGTGGQVLSTLTQDPSWILEMVTGDVKRDVS